MRAPRAGRRSPGPASGSSRAWLAPFGGMRSDRSSDHSYGPTLPVVPSLVALPLVGPAFVSALRTLWDEGACVFPVDPRLPPEARAAVMGRVRPTELWD